MEKTFNRDRMFKHVAQYLASGQSVVSYCTNHHIRPHNFYYWLNRFKSEQLAEPVTREFVEIPIASTLSSFPIQLRTPQGYTLDFATLPPVDYLRQLLAC
jgi:transposase-like protein